MVLAGDAGKESAHTPVFAGSRLGVRCSERASPQIIAADHAGELRPGAPWGNFPKTLSASPSFPRLSSHPFPARRWGSRVVPRQAGVPLRAAESGCFRRGGGWSATPTSTVAPVPAVCGVLGAATSTVIRRPSSLNEAGQRGIGLVGVEGSTPRYHSGQSPLPGGPRYPQRGAGAGVRAFGRGYCPPWLSTLSENPQLLDC